MAENNAWLEVSLIVDGEMAEAVAEVLGRFASGGTAIESTRVVADAEDEGHAEGPLRVCGYLPVDETLEASRRRLEEALWHLGQIRPLPEAQFRTIQEQDWSEAWKQHYRPLRVGKRLLIVPAWLESAEPGCVPIKIDPGMAFGTGTHPTTQLCLELIDEILGRWVASGAGDPDKSDSSLTVLHQNDATSVIPSEVKNLPNLRLIDVGCGSGILSIAALRLGAGRALAVDTDAEAVEATRQNADLNRVLERLQIGQGSVGEILAGNFSFRQAPLVVANILAPVLIRLFDQALAELVSAGDLGLLGESDAARGRLILSGILADQSASVEAAAQAHGFTLETKRQSGDWVALLLQRAG